jgi:hypothetical protein
MTPEYRAHLAACAIAGIRHERPPTFRPRRAYGPHDPLTAPAWVTVLADQKWPPRTGVPVPIPAALVRQRESLNTRAHGALERGHDR